MSKRNNRPPELPDDDFERMFLGGDASNGAVADDDFATLLETFSTPPPERLAELHRDDPEATDDNEVPFVEGVHVPYIDLHGETVRTAVRKAARFLEEIRRETSVRAVDIITGRGNGSPNGMARVKPAIHRFLEERRRQGEVGEIRLKSRGGAFRVMLPPRPR